MTDKLHQVNVTYSSKEDRLLLRVTTQKGDEYRLWLTRRFSGILLDIIIKEMDKHGGADSIGSSQQTKQMFKAGAFEKSFEQEKSMNFPLGETGFLAFAVKTANTGKGNLHIEILPEKGAGVTFNLNKSLLYMFHNLLTQGINQAEWQITTSQGTLPKQVH
ncbi:MAG: hypothetical protein HY356_08750 [Gammaproteobacteria bacterium]|nr:hypothetical protein [Gammaproteobacteria bacterium]